MSNFDTTNVKHMYDMFYGAEIGAIKVTDERVIYLLKKYMRYYNIVQ